MKKISLLMLFFVGYLGAMSEPRLAIPADHPQRVIDYVIQGTTEIVPSFTLLDPYSCQRLGDSLGRGVRAEILIDPYQYCVLDAPNEYGLIGEMVPQYTVFARNYEYSPDWQDIFTFIGAPE